MQKINYEEMTKAQNAAFERNRASPDLWFQTSRKLHYASIVLRSSWETSLKKTFGGLCNEHHVIPPYIVDTANMLYGMAFEAALKGLILEKDPKNISARCIRVPGKEHLQRLFGTHSLLGLWEAAELPPLKEDERFFLRALTECVTWGGRYPTPLNPTDFEIQVTRVGDELIYAGLSTQLFPAQSPLTSAEMAEELELRFKKLFQHVESRRSVSGAGTIG